MRCGRAGGRYFTLRFQQARPYTVIIRSLQADANTDYKDRPDEK